MKNIIVSALFISTQLFSSVAEAQLKGFSYGDDTHPSGIEWQSPESLAYNKEQPRAVFYSFDNVEAARRVLPEYSKYWMSLNGDWKFNWVKEPSLRPMDFFKMDYDDSGWENIAVPSNWNVAGIQKDGSLKYGTPIYVNQKVIFQHKVKAGDWKEGVMRTPPENWTTYDARNEVGSYRRTFEIPDDWKGREIYINFDGVDSFFYLWINGKYVGFSKNSRNSARFNITRFLKKGENTVAVEVYRNSDGSFLEAQDMFRLPGIFRTVSLTASPRVEIRDLVVIPDLISDYQDGELAITANVRNLTDKNAMNLHLRFELYQCELYSDSNEIVKDAGNLVSKIDVAANSENSINTNIIIRNPKKWSAEQPWRYVLVARLTDKKGKNIETVSTYIGFRKVEIIDTDASEDEFSKSGRYFFINGKPVKLKGVNRHESMPETGHAIPKHRMEEEVMMMKRANINHVRNSHYPADQYWYYLADKYGLYLEDEANLESHEYYYGKASLSHVPEWEAAHVARNMEMAHSRVNNPSVVIWSLGNEAGPGRNFVTAYEAIKSFDKSRPVQYERNNSIVDMGSNQYPSIDWVREASKGEMGIKYPFHLSEYAHSMGNAVGGLEDYWKAIESSNFLIGGAIWDWVDQSLYSYLPDGTRYLAFGGDFGDYPTDGQFEMNGILFGDLTPKPQYEEVRKIYQNVGVSPVDMTKGEIEIFNKGYFNSLKDYTAVWKLYKNGKLTDSGIIYGFNGDDIKPRESEKFTLPVDYNLLDANSEYFLNIEFILNEDKPWANAGYVQMAEQMIVKSAEINDKMQNDSQSAELAVSRGDSIVNIEGNGFSAGFNLRKGTLETLEYGGRNVIVPGCGPKPDAFRAYVNNDVWISGQWFANGLYNLKHKVTDCNISQERDGRVVLSFSVESQAPRGGVMKGGNGVSKGVYSIDESKSKEFGENDFKFNTNQIWTVYKDGSIELNSIIVANSNANVLPRLGYVMEIPQEYDEMVYYGRGPIENYVDRKSSQFMGIYSQKVKDSYTDYTRPQSNSNHEDVRWAALMNGNSGVLFVAPDGMSMTATPYSEMELFNTDHSYKLPDSDRTVLHLDAGMTGLGGASCGQGGPLQHQRVTTASPTRFSFIIRPVNFGLNPDSVMIKGDGLRPVGITRNRAGELSIDIPDGNPNILYTISGKNQKNVHEYVKPIDFKTGGTITVWQKNNPSIKATATYPKIESVPTVAIYTSSEEPEDGEGMYLTDGDPSTIWHTMYSVTVAPFPHWVDFDAGEQKNITGVTYLPRQDGNNTGNIKDYEIFVSKDGKEWGTAVVKGEFANDTSLKTVKFPVPVKGRYIRFMTLGAQDGREYATGAEFEVLAD